MITATTRRSAVVAERRSLDAGVDLRQAHR